MRLFIDYIFVFIFQLCRSLFNKETAIDPSTSTSGSSHQSTSSPSTNNPFDSHNTNSTSINFTSVHPTNSTSDHHRTHTEHRNVDDFDLSPLHMGYSTSTCTSATDVHGHSEDGFKNDDNVFKSSMPLIDLDGEDLSPIVGRFNFNQQTDTSNLGKFSSLLSIRMEEVICVLCLILSQKLTYFLLYIHLGCKRCPNKNFNFE